MENVIPFYGKEAINEEADVWLIKLDRDEELSRQELAELHEWMARSPQHREELQQLAGVWGQMNVLVELAVPLDRPVWYAKGFGMPRSAVAFAASVVIGFAVLFAIILMPGAVDQSNGNYVTRIGQQKTHLLADGSSVQLNTNSRVRVDYGEQYRDIYLQQGEVYFDVAKDEGKPFRVFAGGGRVQAIGTAFVVRLKAGRAVQVTVTEGRVALAGVSKGVNPMGERGLGEPHAQTSGHTSPESSRYSHPEELGMLAAGQGATIVPVLADLEGYNSGQSALEDIKIYKQDDLKRRMAWRDGLLVFSGEPLEQVVEEVSRYTDVVVDIPDPAVRAIKVGGQFEVGDTQMMLDALVTTFSLKVKRAPNGRITIFAAK